MVSTIFSVRSGWDTVSSALLICITTITVQEVDCGWVEPSMMCEVHMQGSTKELGFS